jgi:glycopeptide antibiotics resistance protein
MEGSLVAFTDGYLKLIPGFFCFFPALPVAFWIKRRRDSGRADDRWTLFALIALVHITAIIALTIFPIPIGGQEYYRVHRGMSGDNLVPFATIVNQLRHPGLSSARQLIGNMLALVPLGVYGPELWPALRDWRRFVVVAVAVGVGIELTQYVGSYIEGFSYRITDIDDAMMNATGAIAAFFIWRRLRAGRLESILARFGLESPSWLTKP